MKVQVSKEKLIVSVLCFLYIFEYTLYGQPISGLKYIIQALCVFMFICRDKNIIFILPRDPVILFFVITFGIIPVSQAIIEGSLTIAAYTAVMWIFIICTYSLGKQLDTKEKKQGFVKLFAVIGTVVVLVCVILNYTNLFNANAILSNFGNELNIVTDIKRRERSGFGFMHVNSLGGICVSIIIALVMSEYQNRTVQTIRNFAIAFIFLVMLNTGSRASIYGTLVFFLVLAGEKLYFKSKDIFKFCMKALLTIAMVMALSWVYNTVQNDFEFVSNITSGRIDGWIYDLTQMKQDGTLLFGYGLYNPTSFFTQSFAKGMIVDNWFVYMITNIGLVGLIGCLLLIGFILYRLVTLCVGGDGINQKAVALFVANLFHAMAEKAFITPADPISFFMMVMIFGTLYGNNEIQSKREE